MARTPDHLGWVDVWLSAGLCALVIILLVLIGARL